MLTKHISDYLLLTNQTYLNTCVNSINPVLFHKNFTKYSLYIINIIRVFLINFGQSTLQLQLKTIENIIGSHGGNVRKSILNSLQELNNSFFSIDKKEYSYFSNYKFDEDKKLITLEFENSTIKLLYNNINEKLLWFYTFGMKSKYGIAIYELMLLNSFKFLSIDIESLKKYLKLGNKDYDNISNLKRTIINPSIKDINTFSLYNISYEIVNKAIYFVIQEKPLEAKIKINEVLLSNNEIKYNILKLYMSK